MNSVSLTIFKQKNTMALKTSETGEFRFVFKKMVLVIPRITVNSEIQLQIERRLATTPAAYSYLHFKCSDYLINKNINEYKIENVCLGDFLPHEMIVVINTLEASSGEYKSSFLNFQPHGIEQLYASLDGTHWPGLPYQCDFSSTSNQYLRPYSNLFEREGNWCDVGSWISPKRWKEGGYCLFRISFLTTPFGPCENSIDPQKTAQIRLNVKFKENTDKVLKLFVLSRTWVTLYLDSARQTLRNFAV